uniref:RRM domain-containing protein n=1 Tax=Araucaria cunninghamii TaxID=56994 RepID=A0A0D6R6R2_ARACU
MTVDDENSVYVGGLPYESTEDSVQRAFEIYGTVIAVKIVNDREIGGKCYGFVTFNNPRAAVNAIKDMDGRTIGGRIVRVNEVKSKSSRATFTRDNRFRDRDRDRERDRDKDEDRERYRDRTRDTDRDRDRDRDQDMRFRSRIGGTRYISPAREQKPSPTLYSTRKRTLHERGRSPRGRSPSGSSSDRKRNVSPTPPPKRSERVQTDDNSSRQRATSISKEKDLKKVKELDEANQRFDELKNEIERMEQESDKKSLHISDLHKKTQKLEESIAATKKTIRQRETRLRKLQNCFLQIRDYTEKLKSSEEELQSLVDASILDLNGVEDRGNEDWHSSHANGIF